MLEDIKQQIQYASTWAQIDELVKTAISTFGKDACEGLIKYANTRKDWVL